jgi:transcriptional regulator with XRE-family HTH domain
MRTNKNKLAERLKELRKARGLTQRDMARQFRLSDVGLGAWERGDTEPSIDNVIRLCELFGCTSDSLIGLAPPPKLVDKAKLDELKRRLNELASEISALAALC